MDNWETYELAEQVFEQNKNGKYERTKYRYGVHGTIHSKEEVGIYLSGDIKTAVFDLDGTQKLNFKMFV